MANVWDFGAAGDGIADDTAALQHAIDAGDGVLKLGKGTYRITRPLVLDLPKQGYGGVIGNAGTSRLAMDGPGPALRVIGDHRGTAVPASLTKQTLEKERFPNLTGFEVVGRHPQAVGIELTKTMQMTVAAVLIRNCRYGIHLVERNRNFLLSHSHIYDNHEFGVFFDRCNLHQINLVGNHISYNKRAGIMSFDGDVHNLQITGNDIEYNNRPTPKTKSGEPADKPALFAGEPNGAEIWFLVREGMMSEVTIASNTIQATIEPGGANIRIQGMPQKNRLLPSLFAITGNIIGAQSRAIELRHVNRVAIAGNTIYDSADYSILATHCSGMTVGANTISWRGSDDETPRDGIWLEDCDNCAITGLATQRLCTGTSERGGAITLIRCADSAIANCQVLDPLVRGIELEDCLRCRVADNTIVDRRDKPKMRHAIRVGGKSKDNMVHHNLVGGAIEKPVEVGVGIATVEGNVIVKA